MNLPQIAHLLGEIPIIEVRFGNHVLQRINSQLSSTYHFSENMTGLEMLSHFDKLPNSIRNKLRNIVLINPNEFNMMSEDIKIIKQRIEAEHEKHDRSYVSFIALFIWFTLFYAIYRTMVYVFTVESSGEHTEGFIYSLIVGILKTIKDFLLNG